MKLKSGCRLDTGGDPVLDSLKERIIKVAFHLGRSAGSDVLENYFQGDFGLI